jgi:hypothetical protein
MKHITPRPLVDPGTLKISKKRPDAAVPPGKFESELLLYRLCWRWAQHAGHQGYCKNVIEYAAFLRCARTSDQRRHP